MPPFRFQVPTRPATARHSPSGSNASTRTGSPAPWWCRQPQVAMRHVRLACPKRWRRHSRLRAVRRCCRPRKMAPEFGAIFDDFSTSMRKLMRYGTDTDGVLLRISLRVTPSSDGLSGQSTRHKFARDSRIRLRRRRSFAHKLASRESRRTGLDSGRRREGPSYRTREPNTRMIRLAAHSAYV